MSRIGIGHDLASGAFVASDPLLDSLAHYWKLDEASGTRADSIGNWTLTDNNTVGSITGKIGNAARTVAGSAESLSYSMAAGTLVGISYTITFWCKYRGGVAPSTLGVPFSMDTNAGGYESGPSFRWYDGYGGLYIYGHGSLGGFLVPGSGNLSSIVDVWKFMSFAYDADAQTASACCDDNADVSASGVAAVAATGFPAPVTIGNWMSDASWDVDEVAFWTRALSRAERQRVYNAGSGLSLV